MQIKIFIQSFIRSKLYFFLMAILGLSYVATSYSAVFHITPYEGLIQRADLFARGKIISRQAFSYDADSLNEEESNSPLLNAKIGWLLDVELSEIWKGKSKRVKIIDLNGGGFYGLDKDYIFIANKQKHKILFTKDSNIQTLGSYNIFSLSSAYQMIFALDPFAAESYGSEWMIINVDPKDYRFMPNLSKETNGNLFSIPNLVNTNFTIKVLLKESYPEKYYVRNLEEFLKFTKK